MKCLIHLFVAVVTFVAATAVDAADVGTSFTYQGRLDDDGAPADGAYDFVFRLFDDPATGSQIGTDVSVTNQLVENGVFTTALDFGATFSGDSRWLEIDVRETGSGSYVTMSPRHELLATPNAVNAQLLDGKTVEEIQAAGVPNPLLLTTDGAYAVWGRTTSNAAADAGVKGSALDINGGGYGVLGTTSSFNPESVGVGGLSGFGRALYGFAYEPAQENFAVYGETASPFGYAGYFKGGKNYFEGRVGIGTTTPPMPLSIQAPTGIRPCGITQNNLGGEYTMEFTTADEVGFQRTRMLIRGNYSDAIEFYRGNYGQETMSMIIDSAGEVGIGTTTPSARLHVVGTTRTSVLQIDGGADLSEGFRVGGECEPGAVVVIDADQPGSLLMSSIAYDSRVAGIVSGAGGIQTGMQMGQAGSIADGDQPVALTGRVYCNVDASYGAVRPGDLLTTSDTPGHAMKASDANRSPGAILGKAMTSLDAGRGLVLVLVSLQ